ncbi:NPYLR1B-like protein [Dinothrombium tinctorium]|uniref:NPYLR1B-like protein n=1 Tax=Dinothrombium tinctorium TaxID=1965070 RepID=A0A3S3NXD8_9ACAR|nr:NPYLR1B-like protein [Dinothrombium tinctorium]RWS09963.1 NPYLR1B-like protein [Dinothrombium tinctorium]
MIFETADGSDQETWNDLYFRMQASNLSRYFSNISDMISALEKKETDEADMYLSARPALKVFFYCLYVLIFVVGICGNTLVCYVVFRNKNMQTVTNLFITNLALSDILLCIFSVPFTPLYLLTWKSWIFGSVLCHLVPYAQGVSVYISAFTLMSIAIDRFFVIIYPFKPRMKIKICLMIVACIWISAAMLTLPYGIFMDLLGDICCENWPYEESKKAFGFSTSVLQFVIPFIIISFCYIRVCGKLNDRAKAKPGTKSLRKEELERERTRRTNRMLIAMVIIFGISWLPLNIHNLIVDFYAPANHWRYVRAFFLLAHAVAMSSTCYNPFLYAWLNENFRKEFKQVLPCFRNSTRANSFSKRGNSTAKQERACNGHETIQETLISQRNNSLKEMIHMNDITAVPVPAKASQTVAASVESHQEADKIFTKSPVKAIYSSLSDMVKLQISNSDNADCV